MTYCVDIQHASNTPIPVSDETLQHWVEITLKPHQPTAELTIRFVDAPEMIELNHTYRKQNKVTNVLAFPASYPSDIPLDYPLLGDVIICPTVLDEESHTLNVPLQTHWAHIVIHGVLHLLGYDHIVESDAAIMRPIEIHLLEQLGFDNPYKTEENSLE